MSFYSELDHLDLSDLIAHFHTTPLDGEAYGYTYYSEVALRIRQNGGSAGIEFLWNEAKKADTTRLRAILLALTQPPLELPALRGWLLSLLEDKRPLIIADAIDSLARQESILPLDREGKRLPKDNMETLQQIRPLLKHTSPYVRGSALRFMSEFYPEQAVPLLIEALNDAHFIVRENAADELGELEAVEALPFLITKLEDPHPDVCQAVETAIDMLEALAEEETVETSVSQTSSTYQVETLLDESLLTGEQETQVSMTVPKEAIHFLLQAIDYYLNDQPPTSLPLDEGFAKSDSTNGRYYLEAIKSGLKESRARASL